MLRGIRPEAGEDHRVFNRPWVFEDCGTIFDCEVPGAWYRRRQEGVSEGDLPQTPTPVIRAPLPGMISSSGSRYSEIASLIFCLASLIVRPCEMQPGREGTVTTYQPSSPFVITTLRFIICLPSVIVPFRTGRG